MGSAAFIWKAKGDWQLLLLGQRLLAVHGFAKVAVLFIEKKTTMLNYNTFALLSELK